MRLGHGHFAALVLFAACTFPDVTIRQPIGVGGQGGTGPGGGMGFECSDASGCPTAAACTRATCPDGTCALELEANGSGCEIPGSGRSGVCMDGSCVECRVDARPSDCEVGEICDDGTCVSQECINGQPNAGETDIDCGGPNCGPCDDGKGCQQGSDCKSGHCLDGGGTGGAGGAGGEGGVQVVGGGGSSAGPSGSGGGSATGVCGPCAGDDDCATTDFCDGGQCVPKLELGMLCTGGNECASGHCPEDDNVCCNIACEQKCDACIEAKTGEENGACAPVIEGTDPDGECLLTGCGSNGNCL